MDSMCFVCDENANYGGIFLSIEKTLYSKTTYPSKISELIGDDFMVVVSKEDKLCQRCVTLIDKFDKLEMDLFQIKSQITGFLSDKYGLSSADSIEYASDVSDKELDYTQEKSYLEDKSAFEVSTLRTVENFPPTTGHEQLSPLPEENKTTKNNVLVPLEADVDCALVKSETSRDCWTDHSLKMTKQINLNNNMGKNVVDIKGLSKNTPAPVTDNNPFESDKLNFNSNVCKSNMATPEFQNAQSSQEIKKEKDVGESCNDNTLCDMQNTKTVIEQLKSENTPESYEEIDCEYIINHSELPNKELSIKHYLIDNCNPKDESHSNTGLLNYGAKRTPLNVVTKKTKFRPILPKINSNVSNPTLPFLDHLSTKLVETKLRSKQLKTFKSNQKRGSKNICSEDVTLYEENSQSQVLINNIKEEAIQGKVSAEYCCSLCYTECENVATLENHVKQHSKNGIAFSCCFCPKVFKSKPGLRSHTAKNHTMKFNFCCEICGQGFTNQSGLEEHLSTHTKKHVRVCDVCGKKFNSRGTYWIHRKWHFDPLPYRCSDCGQLFRHSSLLSLHKRRKHTGERPFKCDHCSLTFNVRNTLKRHLMLHTKNFAYYCYICKRGCTTRFKYTEHMLIEHKVVLNTPSVEKKDYKMAVHD